MLGRKYNAGNQYRYGFNGKENDNEVKGEGNQQDYGMRIYDPRLGKFLSMDPITKDYPELTPYQFASNCPITGTDLDGLEFEDKKAIMAEYAKIQLEKQQQVKQKVELQQKVSAGSLLKYSWRGFKDSYKTTMSTFSSSTIKKTLNTAGESTKDFVNMSFNPGQTGAAKRFSERVTNFSTGAANTVTEPVNFVATMHTRSANENVYGLSYFTAQGLFIYATDRVIGHMQADNFVPGTGYGDLRRFEIDAIQKVVDDAGRPLEVVGSAAKGNRRGIGSELPIGKGNGTKSDIDYISHPTYLKYFNGLQEKLPSIDPKTGIIPGGTNPFIGPGISFEPGTKPTNTPANK